MSKSSAWNSDISREVVKHVSSLPVVAGTCGLGLGVVIGMYNPLYAVLLIGAIIMVMLILLRQDEVALIVIIAVHLYIDWYWGLSLLAQIMELALLVFYCLARSPRFPWIMPPALWLWTAFILLPIIPSFHGIILTDTLNYYFNIFLGSLTIFWLGNLVAREPANVRRILHLLAAFATLVAIHTIIEALTGTFLFATTRYDPYFAQVSYYELYTTNIQRAGSFLINPDSNGGFFGMMIFLPLGLLVESRALWKKGIYLVETFLMLLALLFTYSTGGWLAAGVGMIAFIAFVGYTRYRVLIPAFILIGAILLLVVFPVQVSLQLQHATTQNQASLRIGAWQTGLNVIRAFPLTGIGVGRYVYIERSDPFRVPTQFIPVAHPHNSYIEIGALAGIPTLLVFLALLAVTCWLVMRNWSRFDASIRSLFGGGIACIAALSANSIVANGWTLIPLAAIGWLLLGVMSSPLLAKYRDAAAAQVNPGKNEHRLGEA